MAQPFLQVRGLVKRYDQVQALDGVSLEVNEGELFGLLGPNGAGKTTFLSILSCLLEPSGGEVRLQGLLMKRREKELRRSIGIVPQELAIYGELTARENLRFFGELYGMRGSELDHRVAEILKAIALEDRADDRAAAFSGGMKRRLNLGAGLVHGPALLLLDEPTAGVDPQSRNHIFEEVRRLNAQGVTIIYTSHYMEEVQALCSRIGIIDHGRLIACDTVSHLLEQLTGVIRFRVPRLPSELRDSILQLPGTVFVTGEPEALELECREVKKVLVQLVGLLNDYQVELTTLETEEPSLERVFLHLTGRGLRD